MFGRSNAPDTSPTVGPSSIAPSVEPQTGQKAREEMPDDRQTEGAPPGPVHRIRSLATETQTRDGAPEWRWHMWHEQLCGHSSGPRATKRTFPQRHPPVKPFAAIPILRHLG